MAIFDFLSLGLRMTSEMTHGGEDAGQQATRRFSALLAGGLDPAQAAAHLAGNISSQAEASMPAYRYGGIVDHHGLAELHGTPDRPEFVLSPEMTQAVGVDALEALRQRVHDLAGAPVPPAQAHHQHTTRHDRDTVRDTVRDTNVTRGEHVPAQLSGRAAKGRKGLIDTCPTCSKDFLVTAWNKVYCCDDCAARASGFENADARKNAWAKARQG